VGHSIKRRFAKVQVHLHNLATVTPNARAIAWTVSTRGDRRCPVSIIATDDSPARRLSSAWDQPNRSRKVLILRPNLLCARGFAMVEILNRTNTIYNVSFAPGQYYLT
jgi:hypothetical protein